MFLLLALLIPLPSIILYFKEVKCLEMRKFVVLNALVGWTLIGWLILMCWAASEKQIKIA